jgi:hypothetical protein
MPRRTSDEHLHEYDDNWQCKCGFRLIMDSEEKTGKMRVKAFITPDGKTIGVGDKSDEKKPQPKATRRTR